MGKKSKEEKESDDRFIKKQFREMLRVIREEHSHDQSYAVVVASGTFNAFVKFVPDHMFSASEIKELLDLLFEAGQKQ